MNDEIKRLLDKPEKYKNKRFYLEEGCIKDRETDLRKKDFLDVINELHEENEELKKDIADLEMSIILKNDYIHELKKENEELKDLQGKR